MTELNDDLLDDVSYLQPSEKDRHGCVTAWLILMIIASVMTVLVYLFMGDLISEALPVVLPQWSIYSLAVIGVINIGLAVLLFNYKRIGFYGFAITSVVTMILNLYLGLNLSEVIGGLVGVGILFAVLQIKGKDGRTAWENLD